VTNNTNAEVTTLAGLAALYGDVNATSLRKETPRLTPEYRRWIEAAPFLALATSGPGGLDCSPRGDRPGQLFHVFDDATLVIPDRRGNNRLDSLKNILADPRVALLFLLPGVNECVRINGRARLTTDDALRQRFVMDGNPPVIVIVVTIDAVYFQCARALIRSKLWDHSIHDQNSAVPTAGEMARSVDPDFDAVSYDATLLQRLKVSLY
jgi:PPOX class probable FMN-dependent enzyme